MSQVHTISTTYSLIARMIAEKIDNCTYVVGNRLPSIQALAKDYNVAQVTIRRAIAQLCAEGRLQTIPGVGTFPASRCPLATVVLVLPHEAAPGTPARLARLDTIEGATSACMEAGAELIISTDQDRPESIIQPGRGVILATSNIWTPAFARWVQVLILQRKPWISVGYDHNLPNFLTRDMRSAVLQALRYLYGLGHRRVAVLGRRLASGNPLFPDVSPGKMPDLELFQRTEAMSADNDYAANAAIVANTLAPVLERHHPTAFFVGSDDFAIAALQWLDAQGLRPPSHVSFLAFCRKNLAVWHGMKLSRLDNPHETIGRRAVQELIKAAAGGGYKIGRIELKPELVEGETCAPPWRDKEAAAGP